MVEIRDRLERMTRPQAAEYLTHFLGVPTSSKTLAQYASRGHVSGPPYAVANGRAIYERNDLEQWAAQRTSSKARTRAEHEDLIVRLKNIP
jgi:hypothetical protein